MWRAVDREGEVLEILVQPQRDKVAALRLLRKLLRRQGFVPTVIVTDKLRSYGAALRKIGFSSLHEHPHTDPGNVEVWMRQDGVLQCVE